MKALVTGGGGFLGAAIVERLLAAGAEVRIFSRGDYPLLRRRGVDVVRGDISDGPGVSQGCEGVDIVFHCAAKAAAWGAPEDFFSANVLGTQNVIEGCLARGVSRLVFTSSPSVVHGGGDLEGVDESAPYPRRFEAEYPRTKAQAEKLVLAANGSRLATVALRPHLIWGPGDNHLVPILISRARQGTLRKISGPPRLVDCVYIDNCVDAHLNAADRLSPGARIAGKVYFISQGQPIPLWELVDRILAAAGLPPVKRTISPAAAYAAGALFEAVYRAFSLKGEPRMTRFLARQLSTAHWFDISAARRDLAYEPRVSIDEGLKRLAQFFTGP